MSSYGHGVPGPRPVGSGGGRRTGIGAPRALSAAVALLGLINLMAGFLPEVSLPEATRNLVASVSVFAVGPGWVPLLLLIGGLLGAGSLISGGGDHRFAAAAVSVAGAVGAVVGLGIPNGFEQLVGPGRGNGVGAILLFVAGTIQAVVAIAAHVVGGQEAPARSFAGQWSGGPADPTSRPMTGGQAVPGGVGPVDPSVWGPGHPGAQRPRP